MRTRTLAAMVAGAALLITGCEGEDPNAAPSDQSAAVMCEEFVKKQLKSPGTAEFSGVSETKIKKLSKEKPWSFLVTGHVDSQNGFGATVRSEYGCVIKTEDKDTWTRVGDIKLVQR